MVRSDSRLILLLRVSNSYTDFSATGQDLPQTALLQALSSVSEASIPEILLPVATAQVRKAPINSVAHPITARDWIMVASHKGTGGLSSKRHIFRRNKKG